MNLRQDRMTNEERLQALLQYKKPDRMPIGNKGFMEFSARNFGYPKILNYTDPEKSFYSQKQTAEQYGWDAIPHYLPGMIIGAVDFGGGIRLPESDYQQGILMNSYPVKTEDDVARLELPDPKTAGRIPLAREFGRLQKEHGMPVWLAARSPFAMAAYLCGLDRFGHWMMKKPELCHRLLKLSMDHYLGVIEDWAETFGTEKLTVYMATATESNQVISGRQFEQFALPYHVQFHERLGAIGVKRFLLHLCGDVNLNIPYLSEASPWSHPSILSFSHEVDIEVAAGYFPQDIIYGNIEPAVILEGTPRQIYELCRVAIEKGRKAPGGFILAPGCEPPASTPPLNAFALTKAVNDLGWYE